MPRALQVIEIDAPHVVRAAGCVDHGGRRGFQPIAQEQGQQERLEASRGVVINTSSGAHHMGRLDFDDLENAAHYSPWRAYGTAKLMNILHAIEINRRFQGVGAVSFHPGVVATGFAREGSSLVRFWYASPLGRLFMIAPEKGADTLVWLATSRDWQPGAYYHKRRRARTSSQATPENAHRLWDASAAMVR